jgi:hypothetical protein
LLQASPSTSFSLFSLFSFSSLNVIYLSCFFFFLYTYDIVQLHITFLCYSLLYSSFCFLSFVRPGFPSTSIYICVFLRRFQLVTFFWQSFRNEHKNTGLSLRNPCYFVTKALIFLLRKPCQKKNVTSCTVPIGWRCINIIGICLQKIALSDSICDFAKNILIFRFSIW